MFPVSTENTLTGLPDPLTKDAVDQQFCWEQVVRIRPTFRYSYLYAGKEISARLLALYAMFSSIEELHCRIGDENVARVKLGWWHQQLLGEQFGISDHPVTRQLFRTGAITIGARDDLQSMLKTAITRLDAAAPADEHELKSMCIEIGLYQMRLEFGLQGENEPYAGQESACAVNGLVQLLRESSRTQKEPWWWVPLSYLAREGLSRVALERITQREAASQIMMRICELGLSWAQAGLIQFPQSTSRNFSRRELVQKQALLHWCIQTELHARALGKLRESLRGSGLERLAGRFNSTTFGDAWCAWRSARKWVKKW